MAIRELELQLSGIEVSPEARRYIAAANQAIDAYDDAHAYREKPNFLHCDPELLHAALAYLTEQDLTVGRVYCEWGSGWGMGVCLAALLGYTAHGIENDPEVLEYSVALAEAQGIEVQIHLTNYFPEGFSSYSGTGGEELILPEDYPTDGSAPEHWPHYEGMDHDTDEIDVFFVYPWPQEYEMMLELFEAVAGDGAILIAFFEGREICAYQKLLVD